ncbi:helix-turn-helix transcriptional regulator [bacterium]|nr:helix-turn-helix transcriptional regulator [bacterium]
MPLPKWVDLLNQRMEELGVNRYQLAKRIGAPYSTVSTWFRDAPKGKKPIQRPPMKYLSSLCEALTCTEEYFSQLTPSKPMPQIEKVHAKMQQLKKSDLNRIEDIIDAFLQSNGNH